MVTMKKRKGDVALQQMITSIAFLIVAALMILAAVLFVQKAFSQTNKMGQKETFDNLIKALEHVDEYGDYENTAHPGKAFGSVIITINEAHRLYGFGSDATILIEKGGDPVTMPDECGGNPCFCVCATVECNPKKLVDCKAVSLQKVLKYAATPTMYDDLNLGAPHGTGSDGKPVVYVAFSGKQGFSVLGKSWGVRPVYFEFDSTTHILTFSDKEFK
jgi:hypothetical protein